MDLTTLPRDQKLAAALYVLSREDLPLPDPPKVRDMLELGAGDVTRSIDRIRGGEPHRFANLFGAIGGTSGGAFGAAIGKLLPERGAWTATLIGTIVGTYPPAIVGAAIDRVID